MIYTLQITADTRQDHPVLHKPISIETFEAVKDVVSDAELDMVAEAFKAQIRGLLDAMVRR